MYASSKSYKVVSPHPSAAVSGQRTHIVDNDLVVHTRGLGIIQLQLCLRKSLEDGLLLVCAPAPEALLQDLLGRGCNEDVASREARSLDLLDALHLNVQYHNLTLGALLVDGRLARAVEVVAELGTICMRQATRSVQDSTNKGSGLV